MYIKRSPAYGSGSGAKPNEITVGARCGGTDCVYHAAIVGGKYWQMNPQCNYCYITGRTRTAQIYARNGIDTPSKAQAKAIDKALCPFYQTGNRKTRPDTIVAAECRAAAAKKKAMEAKQT